MSIAFADELVTRARGPATATRSDLRVRSWVLLLLDAISQVGLSPISKLRFHRLAYYTNCLARLYGLPSADERIVKFVRGPFYPDLQWHLDRLAAIGLARVSAVRHFTDDSGPWMDANYAIARNGVGVVQTLVQLTNQLALANFLLEVSKAYAAQDDADLNDMLLSDVTYDDRRRGLGSVIDFSTARDNLSVQVAESFAELVRFPRLLTLEDRIHLYTEYVDRRSHRRVG